MLAGGGEGGGAGGVVAVGAGGWDVGERERAASLGMTGGRRAAEGAGDAEGDP